MRNTGIKFNFMTIPETFHCETLFAMLGTSDIGAVLNHANIFND